MDTDQPTKPYPMVPSGNHIQDVCVSISIFMYATLEPTLHACQVKTWMCGERAVSPYIRRMQQSGGKLLDIIHFLFDIVQLWGGAAPKPAAYL